MDDGGRKPPLSTVTTGLSPPRGPGISPGLRGGGWMLAKCKLTGEGHGDASSPGVCTQIAAHLHKPGRGRAPDPSLDEDPSFARPRDVGDRAIGAVQEVTAAPHLDVSASAPPSLRCGRSVSESLEFRSRFDVPADSILMPGRVGTALVQMVGRLEG